MEVEKTQRKEIKDKATQMSVLLARPNKKIYNHDRNEIIPRDKHKTNRAGS